MSILAEPPQWMVFAVATRPFGEWLREQRESRGLSVRGLAAKAGITHSMISQIENAKTGATRDMVRQLADGLEVDRSDAVRAWLEDEGQEGGAIVYVTEPDEVRVVESYSGIKNPRNRRLAESLLDQLRQSEREESIGGGIDRDVVRDDDAPIHFERPDEE